MLFGCQAVQKQTDKEAPNQIQQKEGRKEIKKSGGKRNKKETKNPSEGRQNTEQEAVSCLNSLFCLGTDKRKRKKTEKIKEFIWKLLYNKGNQ